MGNDLDEALLAISALETPVFESPTGALISSFRWEVTGVPSMSATFASAATGPRRRGELKVVDLIAQSGLTHHLLRQALTRQQIDAIMAYYTLPESEYLISRKVGSLRRMLRRLKLKACRCPPKAFYGFADEWCHLRRTRPLAWWGRQWQVPESTVAGWKNGKGRNRQKPGIVYLLNVELASAEGAAADVFTLRGLVGSAWDAGG